MSDQERTPRSPWARVASSFCVLPARTMLELRSLERHQAARARLAPLQADEPPLALLFLSHRWESLEHPDPTGRQLRALQQLLRRILVCVEAMFLPREERLRLVPTLEREGTLQAQEIARRILGFGPFAEDTAFVPAVEAKRSIAERVRRHHGDRARLHAWLADHIGVWVDYTCMPQKPLLADEIVEFQRAMSALGELVRSSTVVALRYRGDEYGTRGWCATEFHLGSARSFGRALFVDVDGLAREAQVELPHAPPAGQGSDPLASVPAEGHRQALEDFRRECKQWSSLDAILADASPPAPWGALRDLQGSSLPGASHDPNPGRLAVDAVREIEEALVRAWLMSERPRAFDLGRGVTASLERVGVRCSDPKDLPYLGFLLAAGGWVEAFRPLFRACLERHLEHAGRQGDGPRIVASLEPPDEAVRAAFRKVRPSTPGTWRFRLSAHGGTEPSERAVVEQVRSSLAADPPRFVLLDPAAAPQADEVEELL